MPILVLVLSETARVSTRRIRDTATRMTEIVQNLLGTSRIERGEIKLNLAPTDLSAALQSVIEACRQAIDDSSAE